MALVSVHNASLDNTKLGEERAQMGFRGAARWLEKLIPAVY